MAIPYSQPVDDAVLDADCANGSYDLCDNARAAISSLPTYTPGADAMTMSVLTGNRYEGGNAVRTT